MDIKDIKIEIDGVIYPAVKVIEEGRPVGLYVALDAELEQVKIDDIETAICFAAGALMMDGY